MTSIDQFITECDSALRGGNVDQARARVLVLAAGELHRDHLPRVANLCRRVDLPLLGLKLLAPVVGVRKRNWKTARAGEVCEYAALLQKCGATREALWLLERVDSAEAPEVHLHRAYCHFRNWDSVSAHEALQHFLSSDLSPYLQAIGSVNLAAALVGQGRRQEARELINEHLELAQGNGFYRLQANMLEIRSQTHVEDRDFKSAHLDLEAAADLCRNNMGVEKLFVQKWQAVLAAVELGQTEKLRLYRADAVGLKHWESVREADRYLLRVEFERERFDHLYFGSAAPIYRENLKREHTSVKIAPHYLFGQGEGPILNLDTLALASPLKLSHPSSKVSSLLHILCSDFYRPFSVGQIFSELFRGENFDFVNSYHRVQQMIYRLRNWLEQNELPVAIREVDSMYRFEVTGPLRVLIREQHEPVDTMTARLQALRALLVSKNSNRNGPIEFTSNEVCRTLRFSPSTFTALMKSAIEANQVIRIGSGRSTKYRFMSESSGENGLLHAAVDSAVDDVDH